MKVSSSRVRVWRDRPTVLLRFAKGGEKYTGEERKTQVQGDIVRNVHKLLVFFLVARGGFCKFRSRCKSFGPNDSMVYASVL